MGTDRDGGRVGVITGAGNGIGRALALRLAGAGTRLALWDAAAVPLEETAARCRESGARVRTEVVDVTDREAVAERAAAVQTAFGSVDAVLCVAGVIHTGTLLDSELADSERVMNVNFWGTVNTVKAFLPFMIARGGNVVTVSSALGLLAFPGYGAYSASKFAVRALSDALRQELALAGHPVRVSCAYPGGVRTGIIRTGSYAAGEDPAAVEARFDRHIARTSPEAAAAAILRGMERGRAEILVGADARAVRLLARVTGAGSRRLLVGLLRRAHGTRRGTIR